MKIIYTDQHQLHSPSAELHRGAFVTPHEGTHRMDKLIAGLKRAGFNDLSEPQSHTLDPIHAVHTAEYIHFLQTAWQRWQDAGYSGDVLPMSYPHRPRHTNPPADIDGAAGYFSFSADTPINETSWAGVKAVADCAITAADAVSGGDKAALALIRPPGHHAGADYMGGYCLLNNTAIAAQRFLRMGAKRVAILDVDFHHGNGTQDIFYARDDVLFTSIHGEPDHHFPYFWGHADETGEDVGAGFNANYPLPAGTDFVKWSEALTDALKRIKAFKPDALAVSLGVDTFEQDPISAFKLSTEDYPAYGASLAKLGLPTVFITEGGYGVPEIGDNVAGVLTGFMDI